MNFLFDVSGTMLKRFGVTLATGFLLCSSATIAQQADTEVIANAGDSYIASEMILSWTIGEVAIESYSNGNILMAQGFHQPKVTVSMLAEVAGFKNDVSLFPNPAVEYINIQLSNNFSQANLTNVKAELRDITGKLVFTGEFSGRAYTIDLERIANGSYILQLTSAQQTLLGSYKIEKLK
ncbi:MAG: T9SS type A sorting domain-containing protein [Bacteroidota bacterium]